MSLRLLLYLFITTLSFGQLSKLGFGPGIYAFDLMAVIFAAYGTFYLLLRKSFEVPIYSVPFVIFILIAISSMVFNIDRYDTEEITTAEFYIIRFILYVVSALVVYNMLKNNMISRTNFNRTLIISALFLCAAGFIQLAVLPDLGVLNTELGWDPHKNRIVSTFFDPNFLGAYLVLILTPILIDLINGKKTKFNIISAITIVITIFFTFSRSSWGMLGVVILMLGIFKKRQLLLYGLLVCFLTYFLVPRVQTRIAGITDPADSARLRLESWEHALIISGDNLLNGVGFNAYRYAQKEYGFLGIDNFAARSGSGADSSLLFVLATTGLLGLVTYLVGLLFPFFDNILSNDKKRILMIVLIPAILLESQFINSLFYPQIMFVLLTLMFSSVPDKLR